MHKLFLLGISLLLTISTLLAQNDKGKKVETQFLQIPGYDISTTDPTTVQWIENYAFFDGNECPPEYWSNHPELYN